MTRFIVLGTVEPAIEIEESLLGRKLPPSFRQWLLKSNGQELHGVRVYPVRDERDTRKTWESLSYTLRNDWAEQIDRFGRLGILLTHLLPFADSGTHDYYCFNYSKLDDNGECPVVVWSHESGLANDVALNFSEFKNILGGREIREKE